MNRRNIITTILVLVAMTTGAQEKVTLQGSIQDSFLERGLFDCTVTLMRADCTAVECQPKVYELGNDEMHISTVFYIDVPRQAANYIIRVQKDGYEDGWAKVNVPDGYKEKMLAVPMVNMKKSIMKTVGLNEVVVKATRIKVKMRGDTLVYDASAFQLPEGSMLQHLIEQLPGARMTDAGEIFINGRKIDELTLNSRTLFKGNKKVLLENLPYFTVKELKVFERQSLYSAIKGIKDENPEYVMDVNLKDEYSVGVIANAELSDGTHKRYQAKAFGLLLTKTLAMCGYANLNNINDANRGSAGGRGWLPGQGVVMGNQNRLSTRKAAGVAIDYQSTKKWDVFPAFPRIALNVDIDFDHIDDIDEADTYRERFLPAGTAFSQNMRNARKKITAFQAQCYFHWLPFVFESHPNIYYRKTDNTLLEHLRQWDDLRPTATQLTQGLGKERLYGVYIFNARFQAVPKLVEGRLTTYWNRSDRKDFNRQQVTYAESALPSVSPAFRHEYRDYHTTDYKFEPSLSYDHRLWKQLHIYLTERYSLSGNHSDDQLYILNNLAGWGLQDSTAIDLLPSNRDLLRSVYDTENSTRSRLQQQENECTVALKWNKTEHFPVDVTLSLPVYAQHERLDYERGAIDTLARHTLFTVNPSLHLKHKVWSLRVGMTTSTPGLMNLMPYRDARNALSIMEGNPSLKNNRRVNASITWSPKLASRRTGLTGSRIESRYVYHIRSVAQGFTYDAQTSAYTYRPENVEGNWQWNTSLSTTFSLSKNQKWWLDSSTGCDVWHSVDYASVSGILDAQLNKVETVNLSENLKLSYKAKHTKVSLLGDLLWRRTWGHRSSLSTRGGRGEGPNISAFDFRYGVNAMQTIPTWNTTLNIDGMMLSRRGYGSDAMNKDEFVLNAFVTQPILHGKVKLTLEGHDLLHQLSNTTYEVNAQGRTETWYRVIPNYVMLRVAWQFNRNPKK
jgi:hypothetical protein